MDYLTEEVKRMIKAHRRGAFIMGFLSGAIIVGLMVLACGCANRQAWEKTIIEDHIKKIKTTKIVYESDTGFDLGTEGLGEYNLIKVAPSAIDQ